MRPGRLFLLGGLDRYLYIRMAGDEVVVSEGYGFGAVVAEGGYVAAADDGEGVEIVQRLKEFTVACSA